MKTFSIAVIILPLMLAGSNPTSSAKETISEKIAKYDEIPVYISLSSRITRVPTETIAGETKMDVPRQMSRDLQNLIIEQLNAGFKTDKFKAAFNPKSSQEGWNESDLKIYMSLEMRGEYVVGAIDVQGAPLNYTFSVTSYFYEKSKSGYFNKIKSPGYVGTSAEKTYAELYNASVSVLAEQVKPDVVMADLKEEIEKAYPKWISKQFPK